MRRELLKQGALGLLPAAGLGGVAGYLIRDRLVPQPRVDVPPFGFFEPVEETETLLTTMIIPPGEPIPRGEPIEGGIIFATPGEFRKYQIATRTPPIAR